MLPPVIGSVASDMLVGIPTVLLARVLLTELAATVMLTALVTTDWTVATMPGAADV